MEMNNHDPPFPMDQLLPLFSKALTITDCNCRLAYPVSQLQYILGANELGFQNPIPFQVRDRHGEIYDWVCHLRWDGQGNPKPEVYGAGWRSFVKQKELKVGDELRFRQNHNPGPAVFMVTVRKVDARVTLFGKEIVTYMDEN